MSVSVTTADWHFLPAQQSTHAPLSLDSWIMRLAGADYAKEGMDDKIVEIINSQLSQEEYSVLMNVENYKNSLNHDSLQGSPILREYLTVFWEYADAPFNEFMSKVMASDSKNQHHLSYVVFGINPINFSVRVPDGNYRVTVTLGSKKRAAQTVVRAESRRHYTDVISTRKFL